MVVGGSVIKDTEEPSNECSVGGYHQWEEVRSARAHVCALCGRISPVKCFERPVKPTSTPLAHHRKTQPAPSEERQAS
ncbi:MAG: hypothetical protein ACRDJO_04515 [Actinomycetota bacterium]